MNGRSGLAVLMFAVVLAIGVGVLSYNAGVSHGLALAPAAGATTGAIPPVFYRPWGWGWGFSPLFFLGFWFIMVFIFRGLFWGGMYRRCGYGPGWRANAFDEWHRRAHEEMAKKS